MARKYLLTDEWLVLMHMADTGGLLTCDPIYKQLKRGTILQIVRLGLAYQEGDALLLTEEGHAKAERHGFDPIACRKCGWTGEVDADDGLCNTCAEDVMDAAF